MNYGLHKNLRDRFFHITLHLGCILRISYKFLTGTVLYKDFKYKLKFFRDGIIRSILKK